MKQAMSAIIKKDIRGITANRQYFISLLIVPLVFTVFLPSLFIVLIHLSPDDPDLQQMAALLPSSQGNMEQLLLELLINSVMPIFFLMIPIMTASIMAASSFVGEKEKHTLETLLYCPLSLRQIFQAKVLAAFFLSMLVSLFSFALMALLVGIETTLLLGWTLLPGVSWIVLLLLVSPTISLIAITLIVRGSAKAKSMEESQQKAVFLVFPVIMLAAGQFSGLMLINAWLLLILGIVCALLAWLLLRKAMGRFSYEQVLK